MKVSYSANKYKTYEESLTEFEKTIDKYEKYSERRLERAIIRLQQQADKLAEEISTTGDEQLAHKKGNELNTLGLKIACLNDIVAVKKGEKQFVDADGNSNGVTYRKAAFILPKDQKIKEENGQYYLMNEKYSLSTMSPNERKIAQQEYEHNKNDFRVVKEVALDVTQQEIDLNKKRTRENKAEQLMVQKQIELVAQANKSTLARSESLREQIPLSSPASTKDPQKLMHAMPTKPSLSPQVPSPPPPPIFTAKTTSWGSLFNFVETLPPEPRKKAEEFLKNNPEFEKQKKLHQMNPVQLIEYFKNLLKCPPVPPVTMDAFLKNMALFEEPDKPNVTAHAGPIRQQQEQAKESSPSSEITTRTI